MEKFCKLVYKDRPVAIDEEGRQVSVNDINVLGDSLKSFIGRDLVFCFCENTIGAFCGYVSFIQNGIVPLMLDATKDVLLLKNLVEIYKPGFLWLPQAIIGKFNNYPVLLNYADYALLQTGYSKSGALYEELAILLTTSGSTGSPKLVRLSYKNIRANAASIVDYLQLTEEERPVTSLPMHYSYGLSVINSHLLKNATLFLTDKSIMQKEFWNFVKEQKITSIAGVPYTYEMLKRLRFFRMELPELRTLTQAGGKLASSLVKEFAEDSLQKERRFFVMYGQTEATARMSYLPVERTIEKCGSIGIAIPGGKFSLVGADNQEIILSDVDGELIYSGDNVGLGYAECLDDLSRGDENNNVLRTGDVARMDTDGFYYITGRLKRFIKIYGNRVNLDATEQIVKTITPSCACVGTDDKMIVYVTDGAICSEVCSLLSEKTGLNSHAFEIRVIEDIPKNTSGKVQYALLNNE